MYPFTYIHADTLAAATTALGAANTQVNAGGTDMLTYMRTMCSPNPPKLLVDIKTISPSLNYINVDASGTLHIGALTPVATVAASATVWSKWTALGQAAAAVGGPELRSQGTMGGNICQKPRCPYFRFEANEFNCLRKNPAGLCYALLGYNRFHSIFGAEAGCIAICPSDTAIAITAFGGSIVTTLKTWAATDFFVIKGEQINSLASNEIVTEIQVPAPAAGTSSAFMYWAFRKAIDFSQVSCAAVITSSGGTVSKASIVLGGVYNSPRVATEAQTSITGQAINATTGAAAGAAAVTAASALPWNKYKIQITKTYIKRTLLASLTPATLPTPPTPPASPIPGKATGTATLGPAYSFTPSGVTSAPPTTTTGVPGVTIVNKAGGGLFVPLNVPIGVGAKVTFENDDDADIVINCNYPGFPATGLPVVNKGGTAVFTFAIAGTYQYWAQSLPNYKGTITVS